MRPMRKKHLEVKDPVVIRRIMQDCKVLRVAFYDEGDIYVVPVNFGFEMTEEGTNLYFHGASVGRKAELSTKGGKVGFEMDANCEIVPAELACDFSMRYESIIGTGEVCRLTEKEDKIHALNQLMLHDAGRTFEFPEKMLNATGVFKIRVEELSCKFHD